MRKMRRSLHSMEIYYSDADRTRQQAAVEEMKEAAAESCVEVHAGLQQHLGAADPYELTVEAPEPRADRIQPDPTGCW